MKNEKKKKILTKIFSLFAVAVLCFSLFAVPSFATSSEVWPIPEGINGGAETYPNYPYVCPTDRYSVYFVWPFEYGLIPTDGERTFNLSTKVGATLDVEPEYYARVVMSAWFNGNLYTDYTITEVYVDGVVYPSSYYTVSTDLKTGLYTFEVDLERIGKEYQYVSVDFDVSFNGSYVPDYFSAAISPDDYEIDRTADYIMLSAGFYLRTYDYAKGTGYQAGYNTGVSEFNNVPEAVFTIVSAPFEAITNFLNFEILGINLKSIIAFLVMAVLVVFIVKKVKD